MEGKKPKILLCEDDPNLGMVLKNYLELSDFDVTLERDGRLGLAAFQRERFDLCLLDIMMPHMDGYQTIGVIRTDPAFRRLPIIALTAKAMKGDREKCLEAGASDYLAKPVNTEQLLLAIRMWLHR